MTNQIIDVVEAGIPGITGRINHASAESISSLSEPDVEISGLPGDQAIHFKIPAGKDGSNVLPTAEAIAQEIEDPGSVASQVLDDKIRYLVPLSFKTYPSVEAAEAGFANGEFGVGALILIDYNL